MLQKWSIILATFLIFILAFQNFDNIETQQLKNIKNNKSNFIIDEHFSDSAIDAIEINCSTCHYSVEPSNLTDIPSLIQRGLIYPGDLSSPLWQSIESSHMISNKQMNEHEKTAIKDLILFGIQPTD